MGTAYHCHPGTPVNSDPSANHSTAPELPWIVDAHHHLWDLRANYYPWLSDRIGPRMYGDYASVRRDYLVQDFRADIGTLPVRKSVHVPAEHDARDPVRETRWLQAVAGAPGSGGYPHAIVAYADLLRHGERSRRDARRAPRERQRPRILPLAPATSEIGLRAAGRRRIAPGER